MKALRTFFALPLSVAAEQQLAELSQHISKRFDRSFGVDAQLGWISPINYHLTLAFLGEIQLRDIERLHLLTQSLLEQFPVDDYAADTLNFSAVQWFPNPLKPRLLVATPDQHTKLIALQKLLSAELRRQGFNLEKRPFRPHITLARTKTIAAPPDLSGISLTIASVMEELVLFKSELSPHGSHYTPLFVEPIGSV